MTDDAYTRPPERGRRGFPRGPLGRVESPAPTAIGFCPWCGSDARRTTAVRGTFDCPNCVHQWYDARVGKQHRDIDDFFSKA